MTVQDSDRPSQTPPEELASTSATPSVAALFPELASDQKAAEITRQSGSHFAMAFATLSKERREAMVIYYAFCRLVDDIVDEPGPTDPQRLALLQRWREVVAGEGPGELSAFERQVTEVQTRFGIPAAELHLLIDGMEMDLLRKRYETIEELLGYCYHVASSVGFVCMRIFGCDPAATKAYAENLGYCLQLTNIIRDVAEDWRRDRRIYLPAEDLARFSLNESAFEAPSPSRALHELLEFQYERAAAYYKKAGALVPRAERRRVVATETMRDTYRVLLEKMRADGFQVFEKRYRVGKLQRVGILTRRMLTSLV